MAGRLRRLFAFKALEMAQPLHRAGLAFPQVRKKELGWLQCKLGKGHGAPHLLHKDGVCRQSSSVLCGPPLPGCPLQRAGQFPFNGQDQQLGLGDVTQSAWFYTFSIKTPKGGKIHSWVPSAKTGEPLGHMLSASPTVYPGRLLPILPKPQPPPRPWLLTHGALCSGAQAAAATLPCPL